MIIRVDLVILEILYEYANVWIIIIYDYVIFEGIWNL